MICQFSKRLKQQMEYHQQQKHTHTRTHSLRVIAHKSFSIRQLSIVAHHKFSLQNRNDLIFSTFQLSNLCLWCHLFCAMCWFYVSYLLIHSLLPKTRMNFVLFGAFVVIVIFFRRIQVTEENFFSIIITGVELK